MGNWRWNSTSRDVVASSPSFSRPAARPFHVFFLKICRHRRKERLNIGKLVKFVSDVSKVIMMRPPPPPYSTNACRFLAKLGNFTVSLDSLLSFVDGFSLTVEKNRGKVYLEDRSVSGPCLSMIVYSFRGLLVDFPSLWCSRNLVPRKQECPWKRGFPSRSSKSFVSVRVTLKQFNLFEPV